MKRTVKFVGTSGLLKTEITITHTEQSAYTPDFKKSMEKVKNQAYDLLRSRGFDHGQIKEVTNK